MMQVGDYVAWEPGDSVRGVGVVEMANEVTGSMLVGGRASVRGSSPVAFRKWVGHRYLFPFIGPCLPYSMLQTP